MPNFSISSATSEPKAEANPSWFSDDMPSATIQPAGHYRIIAETT
jgi:hypothetical protein